MDILHDSSQRTWYQLGTKFATLIPDYVLDAEFPTKEAAEGLSFREFADDGRRMFPIDSPASTWLSAAFFAKNGEAGYVPVLRSAIENRIKQAADAYGIRKDVDTIMSAVRTDAAEKTAADADSNYGWVGNGERRYPMFDAEGVKKADAYFAENRFHYPPGMRRTLAANIMAKAAEYKVPVSETVRKEAGHGLPRRDTLMAELLHRADLAKDAECSAAVANVNEILACATPEELAENLDKIAEVIEGFDRAEGFDRQYGKRLLSPADIVYDIDPKTAEAMVADSVELDRHVFSLSKLAELEPSVFEAALGEDFAGRIKTAEGRVDKAKLGDELFSLPRPDRAALEDHLWALFGG